MAWWHQRSPHHALSAGETAISRRSSHSSLTCLRGTRMTAAGDVRVTSMGCMNSSTRSSSAVAGFRVVRSIDDLEGREFSPTVRPGRHQRDSSAWHGRTTRGELPQTKLGRYSSTGKFSSLSWTFCRPSSSKLLADSHSSKFGRSRGHSLSRIEYQAVSRLCPFTIRC